MFCKYRFPYYSVGHWIGEEEKIFFPSRYNKKELSSTLEKYFPFIIEDIPLPQFIVIPAKNSYDARNNIRFIYGEKLIKALIDFYHNDLSICTDKIKWFNPDDEDIKQLSKELRWNKCADIIREKIYYTGMTVTEILSCDEDTLSESEINELKKIYNSPLDC